jgi:hypothetical protein
MFCSRILGAGAAAHAAAAHRPALSARTILHDFQVAKPMLRNGVPHFNDVTHEARSASRHHSRRYATASSCTPKKSGNPEVLVAGDLSGRTVCRRLTDLRVSRRSATGAAADPKYRIGQHVVGVNVTSDASNNAGVSRETTRRSMTTQSVAPDRVSVRIRLPTTSSPIRRK